MPRVFNIKNQRVTDKGVYVGRPSKWGNPFIIGKDGNRQEVIEKYREYIEARLIAGEVDITELVGKDLGCWCAPLPCHADILLELAKFPDWVEQLKQEYLNDGWAEDSLPDFSYETWGESFRDSDTPRQAYLLEGDYR